MTEHKITRFIAIGFNNNPEEQNQEQEQNQTQTVGVQVSPDLTFIEAMQLYMTLGNHLLESFYKVIDKGIDDASTNPDNHLDTQPKINAAKKNAKESMYDTFNVGVSNVLNSFSPDKEMRPDLTQEAIMQLENQIIESKYNALPAYKKARSKQILDKKKLQMEYNIRNRKTTTTTNEGIPNLQSAQEHQKESETKTT